MAKLGIKDIREVIFQAKVHNNNKIGGFAKCYEGLNI